ncbi:daunorubicin C-13 ketoreductase [Pedobacter lusitanus]|uniref:Daunorubicin C-13 ketoreductase n=1 Tax=Pedobacter lusitanus TaxID=1503925 RepID=A0A0D0G0G5_9SPHI|nr:SDR family NAD(P)-dependent oxidoreductase [Pedobacter lusitanus]KIO78279.1 daunorubicin C-13 ketoreductase [Pedobacter lusitanus]
MARIFITGSADGLGQLAANDLIAQGNQVVLHARSAERAKLALDKAPGAEKVLIADLSSIDETIKLAAQVNESGNFDVIIHNAGVFQESGKMIVAVNTLAPYILTALIRKPKRLIYISSEMHMQGDVNRLDDLINDPGRVSYSDSKLQVLMLSMAVARKWPQVYSNTIDPGWVPTKMGGAEAPDNLEKGFRTQVWLAVSEDNEARLSGRYFHHQREESYLAAADSIVAQEKLLAICQKLSGVDFPE